MRSDRFAKQIECLDISLFSSLIGYAASGRDVGELGGRVRRRIRSAPCAREGRHVFSKAAVDVHAMRQLSVERVSFGSN
jgi:hypothetical protein